MQHSVRHDLLEADAEFQSSLELSPECNPVGGGRWAAGPRVSILTRAFARVQPRRGESMISMRRFQSSLELSPECNARFFARLGQSRCFNPHSSFRPSATSATNSCRASGRFQSSLELSPECNVSTGRSTSCLTRFQSSLELSPECNKPGTIKVYTSAKFQSSLELSPECNVAAYPCVCKMPISVSILTRAFARVQPLR